MINYLWDCFQRNILNAVSPACVSCQWSHTNVHKGITFRKIQFSETTLEWIWLWCCHELWSPSSGQNIKNSKLTKNPIVHLNIAQFTVGNPDIHPFFLYLILMKMQIRPKSDFANKMFTNHQIRESHQLCITWIKIQMVSKHYCFYDKYLGKTF